MVSGHKCFRISLLVSRQLSLSSWVRLAEERIEQKENLAGELGEQVAAVIAGVIASIGTTAIVMIYLT